jgi:hypothetical protein
MSENMLETFNSIDSEIDGIILSIIRINELLQKAIPDCASSKIKLDKIKELLDQGVSPYVADVSSLLDSLDN